MTYVLGGTLSLAQSINQSHRFGDRNLLFKFWTLRFRATVWGLGTTYDVHLGLTGKRVLDFLLVLIELISLGVTAEALRVKIDPKSAISLQRGQFDPKFQVEEVASHQLFLHG